MRSRKTAVAAENRKTVAYIRVSTEDQARNGVSLDDQEARIAAYGVAMGSKCQKSSGTPARAPRAYNGPEWCESLKASPPVASGASSS